MRFSEKASRSNTFPIFWAADLIIRPSLDLRGYLRRLALRITWPSFGNASVYAESVGRVSFYDAQRRNQVLETIKNTVGYECDKDELQKVP
jgi:hypothetical protein